MADEKQLAKRDDTTQKIQTISVDESAYACYLDTAKFNQIYRVATMFAGSTAVPDHYRNKPNDCFIAFVVAERLRADPLMFMQKSYVVKGKIGYEAQEAIALANTRGVFEGPIRYEFKGEGKSRQCTAFAITKSDGERVESTVTWAMVEAEGWDKNPKWKSMTDHMFKYRAAAFLIREVCPEVLLGMYTKEELEDIEGQPRPEKKLPESDLNERLTRKVESVVKEPENKPEPPSEPDIEAEIAAAKAEDDEISSEDAQIAPESTNNPAPTPQAGSGIDPSERYYCKSCDKVFAETMGAQKNLCRHCLSDDIVDRLKTE